MTREGLVEPFAIHALYSETEHGELLAERIRYERYNTASIPHDEWVRLLGADVNNLTHMPLTNGLVKSFTGAIEQTQPGYLTDDERTMLELAAIVHDQGEAIVGDITFGDKTEADELEEKTQLMANLDNFYPELDEATKAKVVEAFTDIVFDQSTKLGRVFNVVERTGYVRTALRAAGHLQAGTAGASATGLEWIVADVFSNQPCSLIAYAAEFPALEGYLRTMSADISRAFTLVSPGIFANYGETAAKKQAQFAEASQAWHQWAAPASAA